MSSRKDDSTSKAIVFDGSKVEDWFRFDRQVLRFCRKKMGEVGEKLWMQTCIEIDDNSVAAIAQDAYLEILRHDGVKEAAAFWSWGYFWSVEFQRQWRREKLQVIKDYLEENTSKRAFQFMLELVPNCLLYTSDAADE